MVFYFYAEFFQKNWVVESRAGIHGNRLQALVVPFLLSPLVTLLSRASVAGVGIENRGVFGRLDPGCPDGGFSSVG